MGVGRLVEESDTSLGFIDKGDILLWYYFKNINWVLGMYLDVIKFDKNWFFFSVSWSNR